MKIAVPDVVSPSYFPALAAVELGCFRAEGLDVEIAHIFPPDKAYGALRDGAVGLVAASAHTALAAFPAWQGVKLICAQAQGMYWFLVLHSRFGVARGEIEALKGRSIGAAPWVELGLRRLVAAAGLDVERDAIRIAPTPKPPVNSNLNFGISAAQALKEGVIDGFWANGMAAEVALREWVGTVVLDTRRGDGPAGAFDYTFASVAATDRALAKNPRFAGAVTRAIRSAHTLLKGDPSLATKVGRKLFPAPEAELIAELIRRDLPFYDTAISQDAVAGLNRFARDMGLTERDYSRAEIVAADA